MEERHVLLCARDPAVIEAVQVSAAALDVPLLVESDSARARAQWGQASLRLLSTEVALRWPRVDQGTAYLVGISTADLARCSSELGLPVLPLPDRSGRMAEAMVKALRDAVPRGVVVGIVGASGGLGVSTVVAALALRAAAKGRRAVAVDMARGSGGLDLLVGGEQAEGLRWGDLSHARGELGELALPTVGGARFLAPSREQAAPPVDAAVEAVLSALSRNSDVVVIDAGREPPPADCEHVVMLVGGDVHSVAAARMVRDVTPSGIVVRSGVGRRLPPEVVARSLGAPLIGRLPEEPVLPRLSELGLLPVAGPARRFRRGIDALLAAVTHD